MTATTLSLDRYWGALAPDDSSLWFAKTREAQTVFDKVGKRKHIPLSESLNSTGSSASASIVDEWTKYLALTSLKWTSSAPQVEIDVEHEVVVLLPPKRQYTVMVHINQVKRAQPLIYLDDMLVDNDRE